MPARPACGSSNCGRPNCLSQCPGEIRDFPDQEGRRVGGRLNCHELLSDYRQRKKRLLVKRLDSHESEEEAWKELLIEDRHAGPAKTAVTRIDFAGWLRLLPRRLRRVATFLAAGETTTAAAKRFRISQGRVPRFGGAVLDVASLPGRAGRVGHA